MHKGKVIAALFAVLAMSSTAGAATAPAVTNFSGSGSGTITSVDSGTSTPCDDGIDNAACTATLSGPVNMAGLGKGTLSATLTIDWHSGRLADVGGIVCAAVAGSGTLAVSTGSFPLALSGSECETSAGSSAKPHTFGGTFFGQAPVKSNTLVITGDIEITDLGISQANGAGTYFLGTTGVSQTVTGSKIAAAEIDTKSDSSNPTGFAFSPLTLTVKVGGMVVFKNISPAPHSVIWDTAGSPPDLPVFGPGTSTAAVTLKSAGTFNYHCGIHGPLMNGSIVVKTQ